MINHFQIKPNTKDVEHEEPMQTFEMCYKYLASALLLWCSLPDIHNKKNWDPDGILDTDLDPDFLDQIDSFPQQICKPFLIIEQYCFKQLIFLQIY
jgi:hypothetical protein